MYLLVVSCTLVCHPFHLFVSLTFCVFLASRLSLSLSLGKFTLFYHTNDASRRKNKSKRSLENVKPSLMGPLIIVRVLPHFSFFFFHSLVNAVHFLHYEFLLTLEGPFHLPSSAIVFFRSHLNKSNFLSTLRFSCSSFFSSTFTFSLSRSSNTIEKKSSDKFTCTSYVVFFFIPLFFSFLSLLHNLSTQLHDVFIYK